MVRPTITIYHLFHSGVVLEIDRQAFIFDYFYDSTEQETRSLDNGVISKDFLQSQDNIFVFVTHSHRDHYNPLILEWSKINPRTSYILSDDLKGEVNNGDGINFMGKYEQREIGDLQIKTYGTTDQGVSFLLEKKGVAIFHAGDLNWWKWPEYSREKQEMEGRDFKQEVGKLATERVDIAFVPVDPRLGKYYYLAGEHFARTIKPELLVPIHFSDDYIITREFAEKVKVPGVKFAQITRRGEQIVFPGLST